MIENLEQLYIDQLKDLYSAEKQLIEALPKVIDKTTDSELKTSLKKHLEETKQHRDTVKSIVERHDRGAGGEHCKAMDGLIKESDAHLAKEMTDAVKDAVIIASCQRIEHYEIAGYGTAVQFAKRVGANDDATELQKILDQEHNADDTLNKIAMGHVNEGAVRV